MFGEGKMADVSYYYPAVKKWEGIDGKNSVYIHFDEREKKSLAF